MSQKDVAYHIKKIHVTATDNELYILASTSSGSSEICHIKSGFNDPVDYVVVPQSVLPAGPYTLTILGINWDGPSGFTVVLTLTNDTTMPISGGAGLPRGGTWSQAITIVV